MLELRYHLSYPRDIVLQNETMSNSLFMIIPDLNWKVKGKFCKNQFGRKRSADSFHRAFTVFGLWWRHHHQRNARQLNFEINPWMMHCRTRYCSAFYIDMHSIWMEVNPWPRYPVVLFRRHCSNDLIELVNTNIFLSTASQNDQWHDLLTMIRETKSLDTCCT